MVWKMVTSTTGEIDLNFWNKIAIIGDGLPISDSERDVDNDESLRGSIGADVIYGYGGNDTIEGYGSNDVLYALIPLSEMPGTTRSTAAKVPTSSLAGPMTTA